jgi:GAF domain-containing protein
MSGEQNSLTEPGCPLEEVLATELLARRISRVGDPALVIDAVSVLSNAMLTGSDRVLDLLVHTAMRLCGAHSAGISLEDRTETPLVFRWRAIAGRLAPFLHGTMPRDFSPCGETVARNQPLLMREPERHYRYAAALGLPLKEVLLAPFSVGGRPVGTVWVVAHDDQVQFDAEDARRVQLLSSFAGLAINAIERSRLRTRSVD